MSEDCSYCDFTAESQRGLQYHITVTHNHGISHFFEDTNRGTVGDLYEHVRLDTGDGRRMIAIHRVVAYAHGLIGFEEFCDPDVNIHHESKHGLDNRPENLGVMDRDDHRKHHMHDPDSGKLDWGAVSNIREEYTQTDITQPELADKYDISRSMVQKITQNRQWKIEDAPKELDV